ncbi:translation initiation factor IF-2 [Brevundimonas sp.]|uniref:translation initiation factor IF-2 n=1 Tax=Brevundimonas sp. TaxID=1871086 RepID=UPI003D120E24
MIRALVVAAALSILAPAAIAQTAPTTPAAAPAPGQAEFEATAEAFGTKMEAMQQEMQAAVADAGADAARRTTSLDAIEARYQPEAEAFATAFEAFMNQQAGAAPATERAGMMAGLAQALPQLRAVPHLVRTQIEQAATAAPAP